MKKLVFILTVIFWLYPSKSDAQVVIDSVNKTFSGVKSITVKGAYCSVKIENGQGSIVGFEGKIIASAPYEGLMIKYEQKGNHLDVWIENFNKNPKISIKEGFLNFTVPSDIIIKVSNTSGSVLVEGVGRETLNINTTSGSIKVSNIPCNTVLSSTSGSIYCSIINGNLSAKATSGSIKADNIKGFAIINCTSGSIKISDVLKEVKLTSTSGAQSISSAFSDVTAQTTSGSISLDNAKGSINLKSTSGGIRINDVIGDINARTTSGSIRGAQVMITGDSYFNSTSGGIRIGLLNERKSLSFELKSTSGNLEVSGIRGGNKRLIINEGHIKIFGNSTSGGQNYYCE